MFDSLDLNGTGVPYGIGAYQSFGGKPETLDPIKLKELSNQRIYFNNIHYQGGEKEYIAYDVCRVLLFPGTDHRIVDEQVKRTCTAEIAKHSGLPCLSRVNEWEVPKTNVCF